MTHIKITYYKDSGKYYSEGEVDLPETVAFHEAIEIMKNKFIKGERPGLIDGSGFHALVTVFTEFGPLSWLFIHE
jgi:hypothetical protein